VSTLNVDKVDPSTGTALELGTSGDTITVPTGAGLTVTDEVKTNKISPATGTAFALGDSGDTFTVPSGATIVNSGTATGFGITQTSFLPTAAPLWYNGDMQVSQRATSVASVSSGGYRACDRYFLNPQSFGTWTVSQDSDSPDGFHSSYKFDCTTANASPAATGEIFQVQQRFEGQDLQVFEKGTSAAKKYTVAFWIKSTVTGTFNVNIQDNDNSRNVSTTWTVDAGDTWEKKICNLPADTTGALDNDNASSMQVQFHFGASAGYAATDSTSWGAHGSAGLAYGVTGNMASSTSNNFYITGVQLEVGEYSSSDLPPFQHESYGDNKRRCQRYYETSFIDGQIPGTSVSGGNSGLNTSWADGNCPLPGGGKFKVSKRATPTVVLYARGSTTTGQLTSSGTARTAVATQIGTEGVEYCAITSGTASAYSGGSWEASAEL